MTTLTEGQRRGEFIIHEVGEGHFREIGTLTSGQDLEAGTVLGKVTASGKLVQLAPAASDGSQNACGILYDSVNAADGDLPSLYLARLAVVNGAEIVWPAGITAPQKAAAIAALHALNVIVR